MERIGARLRYWRARRGLTQKVLAELVGVGQSYISQIESGHKTIDRRSTLVAIARALKVSVADLLDQPGDPTDPPKAGVAAVVPLIRVALVRASEGDRDPARHPEHAEAGMAQVVSLYVSGDYPMMAPLLPGLLLDAGCIGAPLVRLLMITSVVLRNFGHRDLALIAGRFARDAALDLGDPAWIGVGRLAYTLALPMEAAATVSRNAEQSINDLQAAAADERVRQMLGHTHLLSSLACATAQRFADADAHLNAAAVEAATMGDPYDGLGFAALGFGPANAGLWRMTVDAEAGEHDRVIERAERLGPPPLKIAQRQQSYWLHYSGALAHSGRNDRKTVAALTRAERAAPALFGVSATARDTVGAIVRRQRRRAVPPDVRVLARRLGVEVPPE